MAEPSTTGKRKGRDWLSIAGMAAVAGAAAFTSYSGWAGLAEMAGWNHVLAKFLPITVDAYAMTATRVWLSPARLTKKARKWARNNAVGAISISVLGNAFYHAAAAGVLQVTWPVVVALSAVPPITLGLTTHLWHLADDTEPEPAPEAGTASPGPAIAEPEAVRAAYPILGNPNALTLPPPPGTPAAPLRHALLGTGATQQSAPRPGASALPGAPAANRGAPRTPRTAAAGAGGPNSAPAQRTPAAPIARNWAEREAQLLPKAREINAREVADGNGPVSARMLAKELGVRQENAGRLIKALGVGPAAPATNPPAPRTPSSAPGAPAPRIPTPPNSAPAPHQAAPGVHPSPELSTPAPTGLGAPGPIAPGALPTQREARTEHANGASVDAP